MISIISTKDGSDTILDSDLNSTYHSVKGALQESLHVFIQEGYRKLNSEFYKTCILEVGFGTGLNAWLTYLDVLNNPLLEVEYTALEPFPLEQEVVLQLNFPLPNDSEISFNQFHIDLKGNKLNKRFELKIVNEKWEAFKITNSFDLIYFDAFSPDIQPEMWTSKSMKKIADCLKINGIWVTYSSKGEVRRNLIDNGLQLERIEGPPGKRHMLRATKCS